MKFIRRRYKTEGAPAVNQTNELLQTSGLRPSTEHRSTPAFHFIVGGALTPLPATNATGGPSTSRRLRCMTLAIHIRPTSLGDEQSVCKYVMWKHT